MLAAYRRGVTRFASLVFAALATSATARAAEVERPISLAEARRLATSAGPEVTLARAREAVARAEIGVAGTLANPTLGLATATRTARLTTSLAVPLPLFGQRGTAVEATRADADASHLDIEVARLDARWNVTRAWLDLWEAQERARLLLVADDDAAHLAAIASARYAAGSAPRVDQVRTGADRARAHAEAEAARTAVPGAAARVALWLARHGDADDGARADIPWRAAGDPTLGPPPDEAAALSQLAARHPALERDRAQIAAARAHVRAEQRARWPLVSALVSVAQGDPTLTGTDFSAGLSFEAPVLSLRSGAIARARATESLAEASTNVETRQLGALLDDAYHQVEGAALKARALSGEVLPALDEALRMTEEAYRDGRVDLLRVLEAQRAVLEARLARVAASAAWQRAIADVERSIGAPVEGDGNGAP
jgi:outer membrane protein, heavy metal efflux system